MAADARDAYLRALFELSRADPAKWATFVEAFKAYTGYELDRMLGGATAETLLNVGMGRRMRDLREDFVHIESLTDKLRKSSHGTI